MAYQASAMGGGNSGPAPKYEQLPVVQQEPQMMSSGIPVSAYNAGYDQPTTGPTAVVLGHPTVTMNIMHQVPVTIQPRTWSTTLCSCCEDMPSCCMVAWCCACYTCCSLSPRMAESSCAPLCLTLGGHSVPMVYRTKMRAAHKIVGGSIDDCCVSNCCPLCVLCQIKREMDYVERCTGMPAF